MAFTDNSDLYGAIQEDGINLVVQHVMRQRPSLFNYGTDLVLSNPELLCKTIDSAPAVTERGNPFITVEDPLPVLGTNGAVALNFCFQLTDAKVDFHPGNVITLPPELNPPLSAQHFAIHVHVCGGLGCPSKDIVSEIPDITPIHLTHRVPKERAPIVPHPRMECFCLDLFAVGHMEVTGTVGNQRLLGKIDGLEIADIEPEGLESSLECYLKLLLQLVILPRASFAIEKMVFDILNLATITLSASTTVPNNPAIEEDQLKVFIDWEVSP